MPLQYLCLVALIIGIVINLNNRKTIIYVELRELAYKLMLLAEKDFESGSGKEKFEWVINKIYEHLPKVTNLFVSREELEQYVQQLYFQARF
ncbi:hypothetical protein IMX26_02290 [Clostridium sp. 'deep sea']|uniref:hypothetical protein n=1 Tax=Clostridium sp. 'deep sea' TaxID=2779445 RepID=UPI00189668AF|nr:hypothetical protein [Clostridium sp. 'deep sea']QOR35681.1 hypothetical protein IMX26_02290 [Clostridium sp. 'deep sea']